MAHRPLIGIVLSFVIGIAIDYFISIPFSSICAVIFITLIVYLYLTIFHYRLKKISQKPPRSVQTVPTSVQKLSGKSFRQIVKQVKIDTITLLFLILLTGILYHQFRFSFYASNTITNYISADKIPVRLRGTIITQPINKNIPNMPMSSFKTNKKVTTFLLLAKSIESKRNWKDISGVIKVNLYPAKYEGNNLNREDDYVLNKIRYGDMVEIIGSISIPSTPRNPGTFNYKNYLLKQGPRIGAIINIQNAKNIRLKSENHGNYFFSFVYSLKKKLNAVIERHVDEKSVPLISSVLLGDREKIPDGLMDSFVKTGTVHFLAISGLHVGILVVSLHFLLRLIGLKTKILSITIIVFVLLYAAITGMKTPITRAGIMVAAYYGAFIFNRRWDLPNSIAVAVFAILLINPSDLFSIGFQLSVLAVLGIIYIPNRIENFFWKMALLIERLQAKEERNEIWYFLKKYCRKTFCVSLAAWIAVMPLIAHYFHLITPLSVLLNIIVLPLIWFILVGGFIVLIMGLAIPILVTPFALLISYTGFVLENVVTLFSTNYKTFYYTPGPSWILISIYYVITILFVIRERVKIRMVHMLIAALAVSNAFILTSLLTSNQNDLKLTSFYKKQSLKITCFDVKHGTSIFIQFPNGKNMLFDTGTWSNFDVGKHIVAPFLWREGIRKIDSIVISHEHNDHCNGIPSLIERFEVGNVFVNKFLLQSGNKKELMRYITGENIKTGLLANGLEIKGYGPAKATVLNPPDKDTLKAAGFPLRNLSVNDTSCVILIEYLGYKILLCADIGDKGIGLMLSSQDGLNADVVQVPHHGGYTARTEELVMQIKPKFAVISGTEKNASYSTIETYQKSGAKVLKTYRDGAITFTINKDGIQVARFLREEIDD